ncbi:hypothetical protein F2Q68_00004612 [Brassica cretica]|uniref:Retrovirus-related Pol polyprotein from transposon TNT 1-94-like beta-barrel domain-containing protein n=1 Tax=Brassica cretica TaxID=69181 RepID=A0A8S9JIA0_BRACR|nr:hypothetical protein F2Q68_00004612 [Brassica cretica]
MCNIAFIQDWVSSDEESMSHSESDILPSRDDDPVEKPSCVNDSKHAVANVAYTTTDSSRHTEVPWYFDSGCSRHMTGNLECLDKVENIKGGKVTFGDGGQGKIRGVIDHGFYPLLAMVYIGTYLRKMMYLGQFGDFFRILLETKKESIIESEYRPVITKNNRSTVGCYHRSTAKPSVS